METIDKDPVLSEFFCAMRTQDLGIELPPFPVPKKKKPRMLWIVSIGVAATLMLGVLFVWQKNPGEKLMKDQVIFTLYNDPLKEVTWFEIEEASSIDTWEPATQFLLDGF